MSLLLVSPDRNLESLEKAILETDPNIEVDLWPVIKDKERVQMAVTWNHPEYLLGQLPNLKGVMSLGAGVNHLLNDDNIESDLPIARTITPTLKSQMADYVLNAVSAYRHHMPDFYRQMQSANWEQHWTLLKKKCRIGIMGMGEMGIATAELLIKNGYRVNGWSRTKKELEGLKSFAGDNELNPFLNDCNILVCLLPLTEETVNLLDLELFKQLSSPAYLINVGRGSHLVEEDLLYALDTDILAGACLDVFEEEPLPEKHVFWNRSNITITPHIAAITPPDEAAPLIVENYKRLLSGMDLLNQADRSRGY